ncbi:MAG: ATP-binding protein [Flavobacterium sp.]
MLKLPQNINYRHYYLDKVKPFMGQNILKVFTGQRRVGKSYFLFQLIDLLQKDNTVKVLYINKEDLAFSFIKNEEDLHQYVIENKSTTQKTYVFIDEIQDIQNFEVALRSLLLYQDLDIYITGSNANLLSGDIAGHLSGRYVEIVIYSLSYVEFLDFHSLTSSAESIEKYMKYGGLPYLKHLPLEDSIVFEYLKNIYNTIVYRDIINRYNIRNIPFLEQLVMFLAGNIGSIFSAKKISDFLKSQRINMPANQVQVYSHYLNNAFLVHKVPRYDMLGKRIFEIGDKYYFENIGIRNGISGYRIEDRGKIIENIVYNHLLFKGYSVFVGILKTNEIDFIAQKNGEKLYFQVALTINDSKTMEREFGNLKSIEDNYQKTVITLDSFSGQTHEGIKNISLEEFLLTF